MYNSKNILHIVTILEAIEKIYLYTKEFKDEEDFYYADKQLYFNATVNLLIAIGEENKKIDLDIKKSTLVDWKSISAMRDKISHNYRGIDESIVWDIVKNHLPKLKKALIEILPNIKDYHTYLDEILQTSYYEELNYLKKL